ncbi:hypothetical protein PC116_g20091 [Phytophthora cactorum]|nr:hypothetical protein PC123_g12060 [Phytophthora cactorum]KAG4231645.1 hypothetical protein PC116_g20091 [Phytophthora cactorum]
MPREIPDLFYRLVLKSRLTPIKSNSSINICEATCEVPRHRNTSQEDVEDWTSRAMNKRQCRPKSQCVVQVPSSTACSSSKASIFKLRLLSAHRKLAPSAA